MTLTPTNYGNYPFQPGIWQDAFIPDQLIAGDLKLVTSTVTITGAAALVRGTVLGQVTEGSGTATFVGTGNGTLTAIAAGKSAKVGNYTVKFLTATTFEVIDPNGAQLADGTALGAYADGQISFTLTAGGTAFVAGDAFTIAMAAGSGSYKMSVATATDGSQTPVAILVDNTDASQGDVQGGIYQMGEFNGNALTYDASWTLASVTAALQAARGGIFIKTPISAADPS